MEPKWLYPLAVLENGGPSDIPLRNFDTTYKITDIHAVMPISKADKNLGNFLGVSNQITHYLQQVCHWNKSWKQIIIFLDIPCLTLVIVGKILWEFSRKFKFSCNAIRRGRYESSINGWEMWQLERLLEKAAQDKMTMESHCDDVFWNAYKLKNLMYSMCSCIGLVRTSPVTQNSWIGRIGW